MIYRFSGVDWERQLVVKLKCFIVSTVLRRSEPSSRAVLIGEQPNPWELNLPQLLVG